MRAVALSVLVVILLLAAGGHLGAVQGISGETLEDRSVDTAEQPTLIYEITLETNGSAEWNITATFPTGDEEQREAFEVIASEFEADEEEHLSVAPYEVAAAELGEELDRPMEIENVERTVTRSDDVGMLTLSFVWTEFAQVEDGSITVGDVFATADRPWLSTLQENEHLRIHGPPDYTVESSGGMPVSNRTVWMDGPADFGPSDLHIVFVTDSDIAGGGPGDGDRNGVLSTVLVPALAGASLVLALVALVLFAGYRLEWEPVRAAVTAVVAHESTPLGLASEPEDDEPPVEDETEPELLSDEERVLFLVEDNGGRMKQAAIVEETDWSNAKVSQLLSEMAERGEVEKLRIGRENLISLPDQNGD